MLVMFNVSSATFYQPIGQVAEVVVLLTCVCEVPGSNLRLDTGYPH